jgi:hypothetical protein
MTEEILKDFFYFISQDGQTITSKNLDDMDQLLNKTEFEDINEELMVILNDLVYWYVHKSNLQINLIDEGLINKIAINQLKRNQSDKKSRPNTSSNSYKMLYKKNVEFNRIKNTEVKKSYRNVIKSKNVEISITLDLFMEFCNQNITNSRRDTILKFLTRMQTIVINQQLFLRKASLQNFNKKKSPRASEHKIKARKVYKADSAINGNKTDDEIYNKMSTDKSNDITKTSKSCVSDNDVIMKNKSNFLKILKDVTTNMLKELQQKGEEIKITLEPQVLPEIDLILTKDKNQEVIEKNLDQEHNPNHNQLNNLNEKNQIYENDIILNVEEGKDAKNNHKPTGQFIEDNNNNINHNQVTVEEKTKEETHKEKKNKRKGEGCKCKCLIY